MAFMVSGIQGRVLEVTVVGCSKLKDTEWISRQDPYVCLEYGTTKYRTRTDKDGGKDPIFQEKFVFSLIEGLRELKVVVFNNNTLSHDDYIGTGVIQLQKVLSQGFDDTPWPLYSNSGRTAGDVRVIMHYPQANKPATTYGALHSPHVSPYAHSTAPSPYPAYPPAQPAYPPQPTAYPPHYAPPPSVYPPLPAAYPPSYAPPPSAYPPTYPNSGSSYYTPGPYHGAYPRPY